MKQLAIIASLAAITDKDYDLYHLHVYVLSSQSWLAWHVVWSVQTNFATLNDRKMGCDNTVGKTLVACKQGKQQQTLSPLHSIRVIASYVKVPSAFDWNTSEEIFSFETQQRESSVSVLEGVDITQTNMTFFRQQLTRIATHILRCNGKLNFSSLFPHFVSNSSLKSLFVGNVILVTAIHSLFFIIQFKLCFPDETFGPQLLQMCNQALFECLALNLHCLRGDQRALTAVINHRIVCTQFPLSKKK